MFRLRFSFTVRRCAPALLGLLLPLIACAGARAGANIDPLGFQIQVPDGGLVVHENAGQAVITVTRDRLESLFAAQVRYITSGDGYDPATNAPFDCGGTPCTATSYDFTSVKGELDFGVGQTSMTFSVPITDHGTDTVPKTLQVSLFAPSSGPTTPTGLGSVSQTTLTILNDDPIATLAAADNPLGLATAPGGTNPLERGEVQPRAQRDRKPARNRALWDLQLWLAVRARHRHSRFPLLDPRRRNVARQGAAAGYLPARPRGPRQRRLGRRAAGLPQLHHRIRPGDRLLPRGPVPQGGLADHDAFVEPHRRRCPDERAQRRDQHPHPPPAPTS